MFILMEIHLRMNGTLYLVVVITFSSGNEVWQFVHKHSLINPWLSEDFV